MTLPVIASDKSMRAKRPSKAEKASIKQKKKKHVSRSTGVAQMSYLVHPRSKSPWNPEMQRMREGVHWKSRPGMTSQMSSPQSLRMVLRIRMVMSVLQLKQRKKY